MVLSQLLGCGPIRDLVEVGVNEIGKPICWGPWAVSDVFMFRHHDTTTNPRGIHLDAVARPTDTRGMNYEEFKEQFLEAIHSSKLGLMGLNPTETLDLRTTNRSFEVHVEPFDSRREGRFYVNAKISWSWDAALTARFLTCEEDVLAEMLGRDKADVDTEQPWIRVDVRLHIGVMPDAEAFVLPKPRRGRIGYSQ